MNQNKKLILQQQSGEKIFSWFTFAFTVLSNSSCVLQGFSTVSLSAPTPHPLFLQRPVKHCIPCLPSHVPEHRRQPLHPSPLCHQSPHYEVTAMLTNGAERCEPLVDRTPGRNREGLVHALIKLAWLAKKPGFNKTQWEEEKVFVFTLPCL